MPPSGGPPPGPQPYVDRIAEDSARGITSDSDQLATRLGELHGSSLSMVEADLCHIYQVSDKERFRGRSEGPRYVWRHAGGTPAGNEHASVPEARLFRILAQAMADVSFDAEDAPVDGAQRARRLQR
eukprot:2960812-Pyramimonas_sp.AAC.1